MGDAFGYLVEFDELPRIRARFGPDGLTEFPDGRLIVSDDTQMTLFTLEGLLEAGLAAPVAAKVQAIRRAYLDWYATQRGSRPTATKACGAIPSCGPRGRPATPAWGRFGPAAGARSPSRSTTARAAAASCGRPLSGLSAPTTRDLLPHRRRRGGAHAWPPLGLPAGRGDGGDGSADDRRHAAGRGGESDPGDAPRMAGPRRNVGRHLRGPETRRRTRPDRDIAALGEGWVGEEALAVGLYSALVGGTSCAPWCWPPTTTVIRIRPPRSPASFTGPPAACPTFPSVVWAPRRRRAPGVAVATAAGGAGGLITRAPTPATPASHS